MKSRLSLLILVSVSVIALVASSGCCRKPPEEVAQAEAAVAQAKENCAEEYAPEEYKKAYDALSMAQQYAQDRKCKDSKASALEAIELAAAAEKKASEVEAEYKAKAEAMMAESEKAIEKAEAGWADLQKKKDEVAKKREAALQVGVDKEFAKYDLTLDLPEAEVNAAALSKINEAKGVLANAKKMMAEGKCNLLEVIAELKKIPGLIEDAAGMMKADAGKLEKLNALIEKTLEEKLAELVVITTPKFWKHEVVKGECLWKIAEREDYYGDPFKWPIIWWENQWTEEKVQNLGEDERFHLIKDPDLIFPGQKFTFPMKPDEAKVAKAIDYAKNRYGLTDWRDIPDFLTDGK